MSGLPSVRPAGPPAAGERGELPNLCARLKWHRASRLKIEGGAKRVDGPAAKVVRAD